MTLKLCKTSLNMPPFPVRILEVAVSFLLRQAVNVFLLIFPVVVLGRDSLISMCLGTI
jgi:hypothetical protein